MNVNIKTFELTNYLYEELKKRIDLNKTDFKLLNTKKDLLQTGIKNKAFLQYVGIDYKEQKGLVKFAIYVTNKTIYNNNNSISSSLDDFRSAIDDIVLGNNAFDDFDYCYLDKKKLSILEEKYNNTDSLDFIYSLVFGVKVVI